MKDTIAAISTSLGVGAISIIRVSGDNSIEIVNNIKNGSSINREAKRMKVDFKTIKTAIKRLEDGIYDL